MSASLRPAAPDALLDALPQGYWLFMILIAFGKMALLDKRLTAAEQEWILERINGAVDMKLSAEMVAMIEPMSETEWEMLKAALSLDPPASEGGDLLRRRSASCELLMRPEVFASFAQLNPGIRAAVEIARDRRQPQGARQDSDIIGT
jgi:hypothetical protein